VKVYEILPGLSAARAMQYGLPQGPSFHFILNDTIYRDNRIRHADSVMQPLQNTLPSRSDTCMLTDSTGMIPSTIFLAMLLRSQSHCTIRTASKEYITFLRDENIGNLND
jgi:hypothetical protein